MTITSTVVERAEIRFHPASASLQPYVGCFWITKADCGSVLRVVPDGTTSISIKQDGGRAPEGYLRGPVLRPIELRFEQPATLIGVRLRPGVAFALTGIPMHSIVDRRVPLSECATLQELCLPQSVLEAPAQTIARLEVLLTRRLHDTALHPVVAAALTEIHKEQGSVLIPDIAARCGVSERHLGRLMRDWIGYSAKRYASIVRFQATLAQMERTPALPTAMLAAQSGYFDQAHLSGDLVRYSDATPGTLKPENVADFSKTAATCLSRLRSREPFAR
jgi:AraC-like DNA-binding protein